MDQLVVGLHGLGHILIVMDQEVLGAVFDGGIQFVLPHAVFLEKHRVEGVGQPVLHHALVEPDDHRKNLVEGTAGDSRSDGGRSS